MAGYLATRSASGTKTDTPLLETPQAISIVTRDQIRTQGAQTVMEALHYTPAVSLESYNDGAFFDSVKIRGFDAPRYLDGLRIPTDSSMFAVPRIETYGLKRIEVLKGPSSGLYGQSEPGGLLNMISKRPQDRAHYEVQGTFGSFDRLQGAFDIGGPVDKNGELLYRIVGLARQSDTQTNFVQDNKLFIAPSLTWRPSVDTSFTVLSHYQKIDNKGYQQYVPGQVTLLPSAAGRLSRSTYLGEPGHDRYVLEQSSVGYAFEHRFDNNLQFRQNLRYMEVSNDMVAMRGDAFMAPRTFLRTPILVNTKASNFTIDNQLQADFRTGPMTHKVLAGFDYLNTRSTNDSKYGAPVSPIDVFNPVYGRPIPPVSSLFQAINFDSRASQAGIYLQDQIKLDRWTLSLTGRQDWASSNVNSIDGFFPPPGRYVQSDSAMTGRVGLNYLFDIGLSPYANYSTSFVPNSGATITGSTFRPTTGEGKEIGIKFMPRGTNLMFTAALFDIEQKDVLTSNPSNPFYNVQTDSARVRGIEFEARGNVTREFEVVAGYSHLDPKVTNSIAGNSGKYLPNVNRDQASLWGKYTWYDGGLAGLGLGAGVRYVGENYGDSANALYIPSYTVVDAAISYDFGYLRPDLKGFRAQINATNLANTYYVTSCRSGLAYCGLGAGRAVLGTLTYAWN
ncbi:TonB-dependent siderophore receptor [Rhodopseudomonas sp. HC1]|uniref:TonB-dependent siderophore receptor n=1 Tax=Rhodopseudomonas infernalis TaxID=2897386 RepID=UPI001EE82C26|nr:TonB-dependent siderophore receptor [Rhodopseudomonas infernalis]MCG6204308.1 TonB-dependent siderophore receptor [Rhodopseudomonas infernalis]